jgi:DNA invertase Pin-like site-specific DNA recombinase
MRRVALYMRVSSLDQHPETQLHNLRQLASQRGYQIVKEYTETSGAKSTRPMLDELMADAGKRKFDVVLTSSLTQIARSVKHCLDVLNQLNQLGIGLVSCQPAIDTTAVGAMGQALVLVINALFALERNLRIENVRAGMRRAKLEGVRFGRKPLDVDRAGIVQDRLGMSLTEVAKKHGVSRGTVCRMVKLAGAQANGLPPYTEHPSYTASARAVATSERIQ